MTKDPLYEQLRETSWRRKLTPAEESLLDKWLSAHPEAQAEWDSEAALNESLAALPNAPVASNFTARVVQAAQREYVELEKIAARSHERAAWWMRFVPRIALASVVLGAGLISYNHIQAARRTEWARSLATVSQISSLPSPEILNDFDAIAALSSSPSADEELLRVMQ
jgi:anti-sigma factor RsiW